MIQRSWDDPCCKVQSELLLDAAMDHVNHARLFAARSPGCGGWLESLPLSSVGHKMDITTVGIAVGLRLGAPMWHTHVCACGKIIAV